MNTVGLADIQNAAQILQDVIAPTPIEHSRALSEMWGAPVHLKCENLQHTGSFKLRGAYVRLARLSAEERARGVVAASAGNHAQGVALAGARLGVAVTVFMPRTAADRKSTRLNSSHVAISYAVFCLKKKNRSRSEVEEAG